MTGGAAENPDDVLSAKTLDRLMRVNLFAGMPRELVTDVVRRIGGGVHSFARGETVVYEGTRAKWVVSVLSGRLIVNG